MAESTPTFALPFPTESESPDIPRDLKALAEAVDALLKTRLMRVGTQAANYTAESGECSVVTAEGVTAKLPAVAKSAILTIYNGAAKGDVLIKAEGTSKIFGDFITGAASVKISMNQHVTLVSDGTNWFIIAGEPKREQTYTTKAFTKAEMEAGVELSASRPVSAMLYKITGALSIGGQTVGGGGVTNMAYYIPPGQKIKDAEAVTAVFVAL